MSRGGQGRRLGVEEDRLRRGRRQRRLQGREGRAARGPRARRGRASRCCSSTARTGSEPRQVAGRLALLRTSGHERSRLSRWPRPGQHVQVACGRWSASQRPLRGGALASRSPYQRVTGHPIRCDVEGPAAEDQGCVARGSRRGRAAPRARRSPGRPAERSASSDRSSSGRAPTQRSASAVVVGVLGCHPRPVREEVRADRLDVLRRRCRSRGRRTRPAVRVEVVAGPGRVHPGRLARASPPARRRAPGRGGSAAQASAKVPPTDIPSTAEACRVPGRRRARRRRRRRVGTTAAAGWTRRSRVGWRRSGVRRADAPRRTRSWAARRVSGHPWKKSTGRPRGSPPSDQARVRPSRSDGEGHAVA